MQKSKATLGNFLSIAAFALLTITQWLHSPLHHLAEFANKTSVAKQQSLQHTCTHSHNEHAHSHGLTVQERAKDQSCPGHQHPHPDDECEICVFVSRNVVQLAETVRLVGLESVESIPDPIAVQVTVIERNHLLIRGPPALNS